MQLKGSGLCCSGDSMERGFFFWPASVQYLLLVLFKSVGFICLNEKVAVVTIWDNKCIVFWPIERNSLS